MKLDSEAAAIELARAARWIAEECHPQKATAAADTRARASCLEANARRQRRDWKGAERHLVAAFGALPQPPAPRTAALLFRTLAALREDQGHLDEASFLLWRAVDFCAEVWFGGERLTCLARLGVLALKQGDFGHAMALLTEVRSQRPGDANDRRPEVEVDLACAVCLAAGGLSASARYLLAATLPLRRSIRCESERIPFEWLECRIAVRLGDLDTAIPRLEALRLWFRDHYPSVLELCLCTIDMVVAYSRTGSIQQELPGLLRDITRLTDREKPKWSQEAFWQFCEDAKSGNVDIEAAARKAVEEISRSYLDSPVPRLRFHSRRALRDNE